VIPVPDRLVRPADPWVAAAAYALRPALPGDPDAVRAAADRIARTAQVVREALTALRAVGSEASGWCGTAATAFHESLREPQRLRLDDVAARFDEYARALRGYADRLEELRVQERLRRDDLTVLLRTLAPGQPGARERIEAALSRYEAVVDAWVDAVTRCAGALRAADRRDTLHNPHGWQAAVDALSTTLGDVSAICAVLGAVSLVVCPAIAPALFLVSTAASGATLAADTDRRLQFGEAVSGVDFAVDVLGAVPMAGLARGAVAGVRAGADGGRVVPAAVAPVAAAYRTVARDGVAATRALAAREVSVGLPAVPRELPGPGALATALEHRAQDVLQVPAGWAAGASDNPDAPYWRSVAKPVIDVEEMLTS
jgi:uncharacterized protein YukE